MSNDNNKYFPPYRSSRRDIKVELYLSNYATKTNLKNVTHADISSFALKTNLASLKTEVDKIDADKLKTVPVDLAKLSNVVKSDVVKKTEHNSFKTKVGSIDTTNFVLKTKHDSEVGDLKLKIPDVSGLLQASTFNSKIIEIESKIKAAESKIPDISGLATKASVNNLASKTELKNVENKIPDSDAFVKKKTKYATDISKIKNDYVTNAALASQLNDLKSQPIADEVRKVDDKVTKNSSDILGFESRLKQKENSTTDLERQKNIFRGESYYNRQTYLLFETRSDSFNYTKSNGKINNWLSVGIHDENGIDLVGVANLSSDPSKSTLPKLTNDSNRLHVTFEGNYFKQDKIDYFHKSVVNIYIVYELKNRRVLAQISQHKIFYLVL